MTLSGESFRTIWLNPADPGVVQVIDQRVLPHEYRVYDICSWRDGMRAISEMYVRGAPLIGATAAWSLYLAALEGNASVASIRAAAAALLDSRPTAVNLRWAVERVLKEVEKAPSGSDLAALLRAEAEAICDEDIEQVV